MEPVWWSVQAPLLDGPVDVCVLDPHTAPVAATTWVLHGRGCSDEEVHDVLRTLGAAMAAGRIPPQVLVAPWAPWRSGACWWVDSTDFPLEASVLGEVLPAVEARLGFTGGVGLRRVGGWSMGGAGALRWLLARPDLFSAAALAAPAVADDLPPWGSSARTCGSFEAGGRTWDEERYRTLLGRRRSVDPAARPRVATVVGDDEPVEPYPSGLSSLTLQAAHLHVALVGRGVASRLRVVGGGHEATLWPNALTIALALLDG